MRVEMRRVRQCQHDRFKSEINLADYATRGRDVLAEAARIAGVIPRKPMPWLDNVGEPRLDLVYQWGDWRKKFKTNKERDQLEADFCNLMSGPVRSVICRHPTGTHKT